MEANTVPYVMLGEKSIISFTKVLPSFTGHALSNKVCTGDRQFKSLTTSYPDNPFCFLQNHRLCPQCAAHALAIKMHGGNQVSEMFSLRLVNLQPGGHDFTAQTLLEDSEHQTKINITSGQTRLCDEDKQAIECVWSWNALFYSLIALLLLPCCGVGIYFGRRYYVYIRDWKVKPDCHTYLVKVYPKESSKDEQQPLLFGMDQMYIALDDYSEGTYASEDGLFTSFGCCQFVH